jgi:hypothetical protein
MTMAFDFSGITTRQQELLTFHGWHSRSGRAQPSLRTLRKLLERELLIERVTRWGYLEVREYLVPPAVHIAWCEYCAGKSGDGKGRRYGKAVEAT